MTQPEPRPLPPNTQFWTWSREAQDHLRSLTQTTVFYKQLPNGRVILWPTMDEDCLVQVPSYREGMTVRQARDLETPPPTAPGPINWKRVPTYSLGSGDFTVTGGHYRNDSTSVMFLGGYDNPGTLYVRDAVIETVGPLLSGFRQRAFFDNCLIWIKPRKEAGRTDSKCFNSEEHVNGGMRGCTIFGGGGNFASGKNGQYYGDYAAGDGLFLERNIYVDIMGQRYDSTGQNYERSNFSTLHAQRSWFDPAIHKVGWEIRNFIQLSNMPRSRSRINFNEIHNRLGYSHHEDLIKYLYGSGGRPENWAELMYNWIQTSGGYDWRWKPGDPTYDPSNQVTEGASCPQIPANTRNSQTAIIEGDQDRSVYDDNVSYIRTKGNVCAGPRPFIGIHVAHHLQVHENEIYETRQHTDGTEYSGYHEGYYEIAGSGGTLPDGTPIRGYNDYRNNKLSRKGRTEDGVPFGLPNTGTNTASGNIYLAERTDGGKAALMALRARVAAMGVQVGSTLPIPETWPVAVPT